MNTQPNTPASLNEAVAGLLPSSEGAAAHCASCEGSGTVTDTDEVSWPCPQGCQGQWVLISPDGKRWAGASKLQCMTDELNARAATKDVGTCFGCDMPNGCLPCCEDCPQHDTKTASRQEATASRTPTDAELGAAAYKGFDDYWAEDSPGKERDAWTASAKAVLKLAQPCASQGCGGLVERLKQEAQIHAQEARTANSTIAEIYRIVTGGTGEPGNWNGAEPVRKCIEDLRTQVAALSTAPRSLDGATPGGKA